jgi:hypothetical protein
MQPCLTIFCRRRTTSRWCSHESAETGVQQTTPGAASSSDLRVCGQHVQIERGTRHRGKCPCRLVLMPARI